MELFFCLVQLQMLWQWVWQHKDMWLILCSRNPFEDWAMATKPLREIMVEKENLDLCHMFTFYNKLSTIIVQAIWHLRYFCIVITQRLVLCSQGLTQLATMHCGMEWTPLLLFYANGQGCVWIKNPIAIITPSTRIFTSYIISLGNKPIHCLTQRIELRWNVQSWVMAFWDSSPWLRWATCWS